MAPECGSVNAGSFSEWIQQAFLNRAGVKSEILFIGIECSALTSDELDIDLFLSGWGLCGVLWSF